MTIAESGLDALAPVTGLIVELDNGVLSVTIDRPESLNSLTPKVLDGLADALECAATDPRVRVVRLAGNGRGFSSGAGIGAEETGDGHEPVETLLQANRVTTAIINFPRPVVAVVGGNYSSSALAMMSVATREKIPLILPGAAASEIAAILRTRICYNAFPT